MGRRIMSLQFLINSLLANDCLIIKSSQIVTLEQPCLKVQTQNTLSELLNFKFYIEAMPPPLPQNPKIACMIDIYS